MHFSRLRTCYNLARALGGLMVVGWVGVIGTTTALGAAATPTQTGKPAGMVTDLFSRDALVSIELEIAPAEWEKLRQQHHNLVRYLSRERLTAPPAKPYTVFKANLKVDGVPAGTVGVRKKGFLGSSDFKRPSMNLVFDQYQPSNRFAGLRRLSLNNNKQDPGQLNQFLAYKVFAQAGVPAPRCNLARVSVNGKALGVYSLVEPVDAEFVKRHFKSNAGNLYEGTIADFRPEWVAGLERKNNPDQPGTADLDALVKALEAPDGQVWEAAGRLVDLDAFLSFWAVESLIGFWDGYCNNQNNYFVYANPATRKFQFIPWGADAAFGEPDPFTRYKPPESVKAVSLLPRRLYNVAETREKYRQRLRMILDKHWNEAGLLAEVDRVSALVRGHITVPTGAFEASQERVRKFIRDRRKVLLKELDAPAGPWEFPLKKSPFMEENGKVEAKFSTAWRNEPVANPMTNGMAQVSLTIDGQKLPQLLQGVVAGPNQRNRGAGQPTIALIGINPIANKLTLVIAIVEEEFFKAGAPIGVDGYRVMGIVLEGPAAGGEPKLTGLIEGKLTLDAVGMKEGDKVEGSLAGRVVRILQ